MLSETERPGTFTAFFPFCGLGAGALGFLNADVHLFNNTYRFRSIGGIDINKEACADEEAQRRVKIIKGGENGTTDRGASLVLG